MSNDSLPYITDRSGNQNPLFDDQQGTSLLRNQGLADQYMQSFNKDLSAGGAMAKGWLPEGSYGRLSTQPYENAIQTQQGRLQGFNSMEYQGLRDSQNRQDMSANATARSNLTASQGASGVRGATASYQAAKMARKFNQDKMASNQDLMVKNVGQKEKALSDYNAYTKNLTDVQNVNNQQKEKELNARLGLQFGYAQMGAANRAGASSYFANQRSLDIQQQEASKQSQPKPSMMDSIF